jgi:hypothetical protein
VEVRQLKERPSPLAEPQRRSAGTVRALEARDVARVAQLHAQAFGATGAASPSLEARLSRLLLQHPWGDESLPSLAF